MAAGILHLELRLLSPRSHKEKRSLLKPFKNYLRKTHAVSVAEVVHQDRWQLTDIEIALVSNVRSFLHAVLSQLSGSLENKCPVMLSQEKVQLR